MVAVETLERPEDGYLMLFVNAMHCHANMYVPLWFGPIAKINLPLCLWKCSCDCNQLFCPATAAQFQSWVFPHLFWFKVIDPNKLDKETAGMTGDLWVPLTQENLSDAECSFTTGIHSHLALITACGARSSKIGAWIKSWDAQDPWMAGHVWYWDTTWTYPLLGQC